jgi:hypothetical protein
MRVASVTIFVLVRAVTCATFFIGLVLRLFTRSIPVVVGHWTASSYRSAAGRGDIMVTIGMAIALWCVFTFVFIGKGTRALFDRQENS